MKENRPAVEEPLSAIAWSEIRRRLEQAEAALEQGFVPSSVEKKQILQARARALAEESKKDEGAQSVEVVEFLLASERYGIKSDCVREIYPMKQFTPLPCTPSFVLGIISVRGQILSVIDIKKFFDLPEKRSD
jgi:purine-binding chemotaxis protein CheW